MTVHIILLSYIMICGHLVYHGQPVTKERNKLYLFLAFSAVFVVHSLRGPTVGWDTDTYVFAFNKMAEKGGGYYTDKWETFFVGLYRIVLLFSTNQQWMLAACAAVILTGYGIFIYYNMEEGDSMFWPFFFYMTLTHYFTSMNLLRQCCAMAFTLNIFTVLRRDDSFKGYVKAIILILIGTMFHSSAVVCAGFLLPFLIRRSGRWSIIGILLGSVAAILFFPTILDQLYVLFPKYMHYEESRYFAEAGLGPYYIMQIVLKFFMLLMICLLDPDDPENRDTYRLGFLVALSAGISMLVSKTVLAGRVNFYYDIFAILLIPRAVDHLTEGETRQRLYAILTVWGVLMMFYNMLGSSKGCVPYYFFWQSKP